jgi:hypothetical protein
MKHYIIHFWIESFKVERKKTKLNPKKNGEKKISEKCYFRSWSTGATLAVHSAAVKATNVK